MLLLLILARDKDFGKFLFGCEHYKRICKIRAPCCNQIFPCRHCHNEAANSLSDPKERHDLVRQNVKHVVCSICQAEQDVAQVCSKCGVCMGEYFCDVCKFLDDDISKEQFHCDDCGICRVGGRDRFFHWPRTVYLFDSVKVAHVMRCGHTMHGDCFEQMTKEQQCTICSKSALDMSSSWQLLDPEISVTEMPSVYNYEIGILCNDYDKEGKAMFHILGYKCGHCGDMSKKWIRHSTRARTRVVAAVITVAATTAVVPCSSPSSSPCSSLCSRQMSRPISTLCSR